jgi:hypothetical protein
MVNTQATKKTIWITKLMMDLGYMEEKKMMVIRCDNQGAISLTKNPTHHTRTKHIDVQHHFVLAWVENGEVWFEYCPTEHMVADVLTKALSKEWHHKLINMFRLEIFHRMGVLEILFISNSQCWWMYQTFIKRMKSIHIFGVVRLGFINGKYLGFGSD